jgi:nucleoside-diphosphate-sugar epimerase
MTSKGTVLITGANGYIAAVTVGSFLDAGYSVRGTVRSLKSAQGLLTTLQSHVSAGRLEIVEVPDITVDGAFDEAVKGKPNLARHSL